MNSASFHWEARKARGDKCPAWLGEVWPAEKYSCSLTCRTTYQNDTEPHVYHSLSWSVHQTVYYTCQDVRMYPWLSMSLVRCPRTPNILVLISSNTWMCFPGQQTSAVFIRLCTTYWMEQWNWTIGTISLYCTWLSAVALIPLGMYSWRI